MVEQAVEDGGGQDLVAEHFSPVDETLIGSDDEAGAFITARHQPEEEIGLLEAHWQIAQIVRSDVLGERGKLLDVAFVLTPSVRFVAEVKAANKRVHDTRTGSILFEQ